MNLKYRANALALLSRGPVYSATDAQVLDYRESTLGIRFPASVREWYSMDRCEELYRIHSNDDSPVPLEELGEPVENWYGYGRRDFIAQKLLWIMTENQGVCNWAIKLDGSDDPPVVVEVDSRPVEIWQPHANSFSEFIYCQIWDYPQWRAYCGAQDELMPIDLAYLRQNFETGPVTHGWPGVDTLRFTTPWGRILIWDGKDQRADWLLFSEDENRLRKLARSVWRCGTLARSLYAHPP